MTATAAVNAMASLMRAERPCRKKAGGL